MRNRLIQNNYFYRMKVDQALSSVDLRQKQPNWRLLRPEGKTADATNLNLTDSYDTRQVPDPIDGTMPPRPRQEKGCTCDEGHKLDCPVHGLNGTGESKSWSIPQASPVGYPQDQPRSWDISVKASVTAAKDIEGNEINEPVGGWDAWGGEPNWDLPSPPCPGCGSTNTGLHIVKYGPDEHGEQIQCADCLGRWKHNPEAVERPEHPDPWMDNEPGTLTIPKKWSMALTPDLLQEHIEQYGPYLYHGTNPFTGDAIEKEGIRGDTGYWPEPTVYLARNPKEAEAYARMGVEGGLPPGSTYAVDLRHLDPSKIDTDEWEVFQRHLRKPSDTERRYLSDPERTLEHLQGDPGIVAYRGDVPPEALRIHKAGPKVGAWGNPDQLTLGWPWPVGTKVTSIITGNTGTVRDAKPDTMEAYVEWEGNHGTYGGWSNATSMTRIGSTRSLYHGTLRDHLPSIERYGLIPEVGQFTKDAYELGENDEYKQGEDTYSADELGVEPAVFMTGKDELQKAHTAMQAAIANKLGKPFHQVTDNDIRNHGLLVKLPGQMGETGEPLNQAQEGREDQPFQAGPNDYYDTWGVGPNNLQFIHGPAMQRVFNQQGVKLYSPFKTGSPAYDGDGYTTCEQGHEHWGRYGAAGLLLKHTDPATGISRYLLTHRSPEVHEGDTWSVPGGAMDSHETPHQTARRETEEELGPIPEPMNQTLSTDDHGGWAYHTVHGDVGQMFTPTIGPENWETQDAKWFTPEEIDELPLHPGFAKFWQKQKKGIFSKTADLVPHDHPHEFNSDEWDNDRKCPECGGNMYFRPDLAHYNMWKDTGGAWECEGCGYLLSGDPIKQETPQHPDPWMDNEPGTLTFPSTWSKASHSEHPKFETTLQDHEDGKKKWGLPIPHKLRKKAAAHPRWLQKWMEVNGPYMYHRTQPDSVQKILQEGLIPHDTEGIGSKYKGSLVPRPNHSYLKWMKDSRALESPRGGLVAVDLRKLDPESINPDEDAMPGFQNVPMAKTKYDNSRKHEFENGEMVVDPDGTEHRNFGDWAEHHNLTAPEHTAYSLNTMGHIAVKGGVSPEAIVTTAQAYHDMAHNFPQVHKELITRNKQPVDFDPNELQNPLTAKTSTHPDEKKDIMEPPVGIHGILRY